MYGTSDIALRSISIVSAPCHGVFAFFNAFNIILNPPLSDNLRIAELRIGAIIG